MPKQERIKTKCPGVYYIEVDGSRGRERIYYIMYRHNGKLLEEKAGYQYGDDMTDAKASGIRADRMRGKAPSNKEKRAAVKSAKMAETQKWTLSRLWDEYSKQRTNLVALKVDEARFTKHIKPKFGDKAPSELIQLDVDRLRINLLKVFAPQTVKHVLGVIKWLSNFGVKKQLCQGITFKIEMPRVDNLRTEDLKLLTHKSPLMTQRYAHLRDEGLRNASNLAGNIIEQAAKTKNQVTKIEGA